MTMPENDQTVYVIDDDQAVRDSLQWLIESVGLAVQTFDSASAFIDQWVGQVRGCLVVDVRLPGINGLELQDRLNNEECNTPVIIITGHGDVPIAIRAMKAGAFDFIEKPFSNQILLDRIRAALEDEVEREAIAAYREQMRARCDMLTGRERQVMDLVVQGKLNKQIALVLDLSHKTVEVHRSHVMEKMGAASLAALVRIAVLLEKSDARVHTAFEDEVERDAIATRRKLN